MCSKILIIGFQRSGTTLLRRLISFHPDVTKCFHETKLLSKKNFNKNINGNWGEKIPWYDGSGKFIINYVNKWIDLFKEEARILHIIRSIDDVVNSNFNFKSFDKNETKNKYIKSMFNVRKTFYHEPKYKEILFENLVTGPFKSSLEIFKFCNLDHSEHIIKDIISPGKDKWRYFDNINSKRANNYKKL